MNNPLRYSDPTGHCSSAPKRESYDSQLDYSKAQNEHTQCWGWISTIRQHWHNTDYWNNRFYNEDGFFYAVENNANYDSSQLSQLFMEYMQSDEFKAWAFQPNKSPYVPVDTGDYWAGTFGFIIVEVSVIRDDFGTWYLRGGIGPNFPGPSLSRGDVLINTDPEHRPWRGLKDVDSLNIDEAEKAKLMQEAITGHSTTASATYGLGSGMSSGLNPPYHGSIESVLGFPGASVTNWSYTAMIWSK